MGKERKFTKREYRAYLKRSAQVMREVRKANKINKTPQDTVVGGTDIQNVTIKNDNLECKIIKEEIDIVFEPEEIEETVKSDDDTKQNIYESASDAPCETQSNEVERLLQAVCSQEVWVVRRQLCRGCHSDGAFWSLQTTTEGDTYGDLLETYFNIQLCPVSKDEQALSAICTLCASRLREARAFSAQLRAAEKRFTHFYAQNRFRVFVKEEHIKKEVEIFNEGDDSQITDEVEPDTAKSNLDDLLAPKEELSQVLCNKPAPKKLLQLSLSDYERVGKLFKCPRCDKLYGKRYIQQHVKNQHSIFAKKKLGNKITFKLSPSDFERVENSYKCTLCEKLFQKYSRIRYHVMYTHLKLPRYSCPYCEEAFNGLATFTKHKLEEHSIDDRIKCNACDWSTYRTKTALTKHKNNFHMLGEKLTCIECGYFCFSDRQLKRHAIKHTTVKEHHCKYCNKSFLRRTTLIFHERIHTGDKRKVCNVCGQAFVQRASLKYHMAKHHPEVRV